MSGYRLEYATSPRSKCKGPKPCKDTLIPKGALRFASVVDIKGNTTFSWRHWGCVTPKIIENMKKSFSDASELDGYEDLRPEDQERVSKAWEVGEVDDADIPDSARKPDAEDSEEEVAKKPKGRKKKVDADTEEKPKRKRATKKATVDDNEEAEEEEKPKKKTAPRKRAKKAASDDEDDEPKSKAKKAPAKKKAAPKKKKVADSDSGEDFGDAMNDVSGSEDDGGDEDEDAGKKRKRPASKAKGKGSPKKRAKKSSKYVEEAEEDE